MPATAGLRNTLSGNDVKRVGTRNIGTSVIGMSIWVTLRDTLLAPVIDIGTRKIGTFKIGARLYSTTRATLNPTAGARDIL